MDNLFTTEEASLLLRLLIAHLLTDFFWQPGTWIADKIKRGWRSPYLLLHGLLTAAVAWLLLWDMDYWWVALIIFVTHTLTDGIKISLSAKVESGNSAPLKKAAKASRLFLADQFIHIITLLILWAWMTDKLPAFAELIKSKLINYKMLLILTGYLFVMQPVGFYIQHVTRRWAAELNADDSLKDAGKWIGMLERILILTFVFTSQFAAIGFLIAAKSILRVTEKPNSSLVNTENRPFSARKHTEYVLIGTFLSFSISLAAGLIINYFLSF